MNNIFNYNYENKYNLSKNNYTRHQKHLRRVKNKRTNYPEEDEIMRRETKIARDEKK